MGRFTKQNAEAKKVWREANLVVLTEAQLKDMDAELVNFNKLGTKQGLFKYLVHKGGAVWIPGAQIAVRPNRYEVVMDMIEQWSRWRERKFPFDQRMAYERIAESRGLIAEEHTVEA